MRTAQSCLQLQRLVRIDLTLDISCIRASELLLLTKDLETKLVVGIKKIIFGQKMKRSNNLFFTNAENNFLLQIVKQENK